MSRRSSAAIIVVVCMLGAALQFGGAGASTWTNTRVTTATFPFEPGIDIGPDGTIFVNAPEGLGAHTLLWRSDNGGASYKAQLLSSPWSRQPGGGDGDVVVGPDRQVYMMDLWLGSNSISRSDDNGLTWTAGSPITTLPLSDRQWIALGDKDPVTGMDTVYAVYQLVEGNIWFAKSTTGGVTWTTHKGIPNGLGQGDQAGQIVADGPRIATAFNSGESRLFATSTNAGETWKVEQVDEEGSVNDDMVSVAMDGDKLYTAWLDKRNQTIRVQRSMDFGATWEGTTLITTGGLTNALPWITARNGKVAITWYGGTTSGPANEVPASNIWNVKYAESSDSGATFSTPEIVATDVKRGIICMDGLGCPDLGRGDRELGDFLQVEIHPITGKSFISYVSAGKGIWVARQS